MDNNTAEATLDDLMKSDLAHYEEISTKACHWSSGVPRAIKFYYQERPKLEQENKELREDVEGLKTLKETALRVYAEQENKELRELVIGLRETAKLCKEKGFPYITFEYDEFFKVIEQALNK